MKKKIPIFDHMAQKDFFTGFYKSNLDSVAAWVWMEAIMLLQDQIIESGKPLTRMDAAREFQRFMKYDEDDMPLYTIKQQYYRMSERNRRRLRSGECDVFQCDDEVVAMLKEIKEQLNELKDGEAK